MFDPEKLQIAQIRAGVQGQQLAAAAGIEASTLSKIRNGHTTPRPTTIKKLADALGIPVADLLRDPEPAGTSS